ncbi:hypothetical protein TrLO_g14185 [Triparma laevis f. longispina]|uniref:Uncharacterized protein n=1 Tax=Triparma laevis f. longispina TaxID=1714387 RepID=A0A9W7EDL8_9STRA|nr:hypothetical protein TrLO_g14185 [Triparma laevis f. longispina]
MPPRPSSPRWSSSSSAFFLFALAFVLSASTSNSYSISRRGSFTKALPVLLSPLPTFAFDNTLPRDKYKDRPKRKGPQPSDLGVAYRGLKGCGPGANCFSTTGDPELDSYYMIKDIFTPPPSTSSPLSDVVSVISTYEVGHDNIDSGGFKIITEKQDYVYAQFESLKNGYIDDVEFAILNGEVLVRSSSRLGYLDYGVNAKRLNWIGERLKNKGWKVQTIDRTTNRDYFEQNNL